MSKPIHSNYLPYLLVWFALIVLTGITVTFAGINFGKYTVLTALVIASIKAYLVLSIFMNIKREDKVFKIFIGISLLFLIISFALLFSDYSFV
ncbi:MAG: cytochrome C oxidase subunit IV family protein [Ignavibacteria bacterium]|nr:cytochrome C oxidase subunit IV family protein [Ignavibacteria bacterium]